MLGISWEPTQLAASHENHENPFSVSRGVIFGQTHVAKHLCKIFISNAPKKSNPVTVSRTTLQEIIFGLGPTAHFRTSANYERHI
jgi:hypothetical protein